MPAGLVAVGDDGASGPLDEGLAHVRKRPGMYFGNVATALPLLWEVVANSLDQVIAGRASRIDVALHSDGAITVSDDGPGIRVNRNSAGVSWLEQQFTTLHAGPTADGHTPHVHLPGCGVGLGPVSALSRRLDVSVRSESGAFHQAFARGTALTALTRTDDPRPGTGTDITFLFDDTIVRQIRWDTAEIQTGLAELAHLWPGLVCQFQQDATVYGPAPDLRGLLSELVRERRRDPLHPPFLVAVQDGTTTVRFALQFCHPPQGHVHRRPGGDLVAWANFTPIVAGRHLDGVRSGVLDALALLASPERLAALDASLVAVIDIKLLDPIWQGPTRQRLGNESIGALVHDAVKTQLEAQLTALPAIARDLRRFLTT